MKGQIIVGVNKGTNAITPIADVKHIGLGCNCICYDCKGDLEAVINTRRRKHFRHSSKKNCIPAPYCYIKKPTSIYYTIIHDLLKVRKITIALYWAGVLSLALPYYLAHYSSRTGIKKDPFEDGGPNIHSN